MRPKLLGKHFRDPSASDLAVFLTKGVFRDVITDLKSESIHVQPFFTKKKTPKTIIFHREMMYANL